MQIVSHTIVKNGMPFIDLVLRQAIPYVDRAIVTISEKSNDETLSVLRRIEKDFPTKLRILFENVDEPKDLTSVRQDQLNRTYEDVVWFLDDDDYWPNAKIEEMIKIIKEDIDNPDVDAWTMCPYQMVSANRYDINWLNKFFTKFFKFDGDVHYRGPWPRDLIYKGDDVLYWKKNSKVKRVPVRFFHLSYLKSDSFREEDWAEEYKHEIGPTEELPDEEKIQIFPVMEFKNVR